MQPRVVYLIAVGVSVFLPLPLFAEDFSVTDLSFDEYFTHIEWENVTSGSEYRVESTAALGADWMTNTYRGSGRVLGTTPVLRTYLRTPRGPTFYRVVRVDDVVYTGHTVSGTVRFSTNALPAYPVLLECKTSSEPEMRTLTDQEGRYAFPPVPDGNYWIASPYLGVQYGDRWGGPNETIDGANIEVDVYAHTNVCLLSPPNDAVVSQSSPTFQWQPVPEAASYAIQMNVVTNWDYVDSTSGITSTVYTTSAVLTTDVEYTWQIYAYDAVGNWIGSTIDEFYFTVSLP